MGYPNSAPSFHETLFIHSFGDFDRVVGTDKQNYSDQSSQGHNPYSPAPSPKSQC
jgi:hypothetical protein